MDPKVSVNIINWNSVDYVDLLIDSLPLITSKFPTEIVVVDRFSNDGSFEKLKKTADIAIQGDWNRGEARQKALEICTGDIVINHIDTDEQIQPIVAEILSAYIKKVGRNEFALSLGGCLISWKEIIAPFGYKPYQRGEDLDLLERLYEKGKLRAIHGIKPVIHIRGSQSEKGRLGILYKFIPFRILRLFWEMQGKWHKAYWSKAYSQKVAINLHGLLTCEEELYT